MGSNDEMGTNVPISALQHFLFCPRQCALIHLERLWAENRWTAEGGVLHERVHEQTVERRPGVILRHGMPVFSEKLGIGGQCDCVEWIPLGRSRRGPWSAVIPIEYKRGRPKVHEADTVQLCAQVLCLEEMLGISITEGTLFYGETRHRLPVTISAELRNTTLVAINGVKKLFFEGVTPPERYLAKRCRACSLLELCLPRREGREEQASLWFRKGLRHMLDHDP
ncbi:MAG: CRISPR-associated protein Cas4 [Magnetococcales bacterium]|nr:CRISPR-associated protein Cas4 [Magnetococcales bacterium]